VGIGPSPAQHILFGLALLHILLVETLRKRVTSRLRIVRQAGPLLLLAHTILYLLVIYLVMISTLMPLCLFLDPAVNVVLNQREELTARKPRDSPLYSRTRALRRTLPLPLPSPPRRGRGWHSRPPLPREGEGRSEGARCWFTKYPG